MSAGYVLTLALIVGVVVQINALQVGSGCGKSFQSPAFTILDPVKKVKKKTWPWIVPIYRYYKNEKQWKHVCTGTIIDDQWVITAAHCLIHIEWKFVMGERKQARFAVTNKAWYRVPTTYFNNAGLPTDGREYEPLAMHPMKSYNGMVLNPADVMLIQLKRKMTWTHFRQPICLSETLHAFQTINGKYKCYTAGWGENMKDTEANWDTIDQYLGPLHSYESRICKLEWGFQSRPLNSQFCIGKTTRIGRCASDIGSPMMCKHKQGWVMVGLEHVASEVCIEENKPGLFTDISVYRDWIKKTMAGKARSFSRSRWNVTEITQSPEESDDAIFQANDDIFKVAEDRN